MPFILVLISSLLYLSCDKDQGTDPVSEDQPVIGAITVTGVPGSSASYDAGSATYTLIVPAGTDVKALRLSIPLTSGATISPDPATARDYTNGKTQQITVKVEVSASTKSSAKQITAFRFAALGVDAKIDQVNLKITAKVAFNEDVTRLAPTIAVSEKAAVSPASGVVQNFTNPVSYTVTAEDGSKQVYEVSISKISFQSDMLFIGYGPSILGINAEEGKLVWKNTDYHIGVTRDLYTDPTYSDGYIYVGGYAGYTMRKFNAFSGTGAGYFSCSS